MLKQYKKEKKIRHAKRKEDDIRRAARNRYLLDVANVDNRMIANLRKNASIVGVDISEFNDYIYYHKFEEFYDLITDEESVKLEGLYEKYKNLVLEKYKEFEEEKNKIRSIINKQYEYGNFSENQRKTLNDINLSRNKTYKEGIKELEMFKEKILLEYDGFATIPRKVKSAFDVDTFDLDASTTYLEKYEASINMISKVYGKKYTSDSLYRKITDEFNTSGDFGKAFDVFRKEYEESRFKEVYLSINKLDEIRKADLSKIYKPWISKFNDYVERINIWDIEKDGYIGIYREIEGAYKILKLSTNELAIKHGLGKLSFNTPCKLIEVYQSIYKKDIFKLIAKKEFYDSFEKFVPLITGTERKISCFVPQYNHVYFKLSERFEKSKVYGLQLQYHEFGHALAEVQGKWVTHTKWGKLFDKYADEFNKSIDKLVDGTIQYGAKFKDKYWDVFIKSKQTYDDEEMAGAISDIFTAFDKTHEWFGHRAHSAEYFSNRNLCIEEFIAHASEIYWEKNPIFAEAFPSLYKELKELYEEFYLRFKNKKS